MPLTPSPFGIVTVTGRPGLPIGSSWYQNHTAPRRRTAARADRGRGAAVRAAAGRRRRAPARGVPSTPIGSGSTSATSGVVEVAIGEVAGGDRAVLGRRPGVAGAVRRAFGHRRASRYDCRITAAATLSTVPLRLRRFTPASMSDRCGDDGREPLVDDLERRSGARARSASTSAAAAVAAAPRAARELRRHPDHHRGRLLVPGGRDDRLPVRTCVAGPLDDHQRRGDHPGGVRHREPDASGAEVDAEDPGHRLTLRRRPRAPGPPVPGVVERLVLFLPPPWTRAGSLAVPPPSSFTTGATSSAADTPARDTRLRRRAATSAALPSLAPSTTTTASSPMQVPRGDRELPQVVRRERRRAARPRRRGPLSRARSPAACHGVALARRAHLVGEASSPAASSRSTRSPSSAGATLSGRGEVAELLPPRPARGPARTGAGDRLDAAQVRADRALAHDLDRAR